jgi:hypothetical protein
LSSPQPQRSQRQSRLEVLLDLSSDITPRAAITDKGYDAKANCDGAR